MKTRAILLLPSSCLAPLQAADFKIDWFSIDCGAGISTSHDGRFGIRSTIGQPDAGIARAAPSSCAGDSGTQRQPPARLTHRWSSTWPVPGNHVVVEFNEPMDATTAENPNSYLINGTTVSGLVADLLPSKRSVLLLIPVCFWHNLQSLRGRREGHVRQRGRPEPHHQGVLVRTLRDHPASCCSSAARLHSQYCPGCIQ